MEGERSERLRMNHKLRSAHPRHGVRKPDRTGMTPAALPLASVRRMRGWESHTLLNLLKSGRRACSAGGRSASGKASSASSSSQKGPRRQVFLFFYTPLRPTTWESSLPSLSLTCHSQSSCWLSLHSSESAHFSPPPLWTDWSIPPSIPT